MKLIRHLAKQITLPCVMSTHSLRLSPVSPAPGKLLSAALTPRSGLCLLGAPTHTLPLLHFHMVVFVSVKIHLPNQTLGNFKAGITSHSLHLYSWYLEWCQTFRRGSL